MAATLYYTHDPMCSWCWAFRPVWDALRRRLPPDVAVHSLLGGLAPDSGTPMPAAMRVDIRQHWRTIQRQVPGTRFNFDFWTVCTPRRSTYPACRAVIAARMQHASHEEAMVRAIQEAYYLHARNPSDDAVLTDLAAGIGLDPPRFRADLNAAQTRRALLADIRRHQQLGVRGFPALVLTTGSCLHHIEISYIDEQAMLEEIIRAAYCDPANKGEASPR